MSNDIASSAPSAAPPASAPASSPAEHHDSAPASTPSAADEQHVDDASAERFHNRQKGLSEDSGSEATSEHDRLTRNDRRRRDLEIERHARELERRQNAELRNRIERNEPEDVAEQVRAAEAEAGGQAENGADDAQAERPATHEEFVENVVAEIEQGMAHRDAHRDKLNRFQWRQEVAAAHFPGYRETIAQAPPVPVSPALADEILESTAGPWIHLALAKAATAQARGIALAPEDAAIMAALPHATERQAAKLVAKLEAQYEAARQPRARAAPVQRLPASWLKSRPPLKPLNGGAAAPSSSDEGPHVSSRAVADFNRRQGKR